MDITDLRHARDQSHAMWVIRWWALGFASTLEKEASRMRRALHGKEGTVNAVGRLVLAPMLGVLREKRKRNQQAKSWALGLVASLAAGPGSYAWLVGPRLGPQSGANWARI